MKNKISFFATIIIAITVAILLYDLSPLVFWAAFIASAIFALFEIL